MGKFVLIAVLLSLCVLAKAAPYQELEPRKGHVPVYIRHGDESLSQIHPGLAEAFKEDAPAQLQAENHIKETTTTIAASAEEAAVTSPKTTTTESDIASFDAIKAKDV